ncbi:DUF2381 family protein [Archangium sp.]|uniref:DUF2381 family protein n=1 Tax=Archangium sp. TaxID=1872627 RepID=UPI002D705F39|nr:DUF2381 family protein [Archangium sp.]HYO55990.1 DUF2381 family protein [Archangium sp.]
MRPGAWFFLLVLLSLSATAWAGVGGPVLQRRTLMIPSRPMQVPPLELHMAAGVATLVRFEAPLRPEVPEAMREGGLVAFVHMGEGAWVFVPSRDLTADEQVMFTFVIEAGTQPLRFVLVTRRDVADVEVRVARAPVSADEDGAQLVARSLLDAPDAHATLALPQEVVKYNSRDSRGRVDSVLWMGRRFFATMSVRSRKKGAPPWKLVQARLRATLADGVLLEWPAQLLSGAAGPRHQRHIVTGLLPEGASRLELALDGEDSPGPFRPLLQQEEPPRP